MYFQCHICCFSSFEKKYRARFYTAPP